MSRVDSLYFTQFQLLQLKGGRSMDPVIDQLFKMEQTAQNMESGLDEKKEGIRQSYQKKQQAFDQESDRETKEQLERIREESEQQQKEKNKMIYAQYKTELDQLETVYKTRQDQQVEQIFANIIKG